MCQLEVAFYAIFWNETLRDFDLTSYILQDQKIVLQKAVISPLLSFVREIRNKYEDYKQKKKKCQD